MRRWAYLLGGWCWLYADGAAGRGYYLPAIGPSPVRFLSSGPAVAVAVLPPISEMTATMAGETNAAVVQVSLPSAAVAEPENNPESGVTPVVVKLSVSAPTNAVSTNSPVPMMINEPLNTESERPNVATILDSLVLLFKQNPSGTNRLDPALVLPANVLSAPNFKPPSSTAAYSNQ